MIPMPVPVSLLDSANQEIAALKEQLGITEARLQVSESNRRLLTETTMRLRNELRDSENRIARMRNGGRA